MANNVNQSQALAYGRQLQALAASFVSLRNQCKSLQVQSSNNNYDGAWIAMPTSSLYSDGNIGLLDSTKGSGTISVSQNSNSITFSQTQSSSLVGSQIFVTGDSSGGLYRVASGSGTSWTLLSNYAGSTNASGTWYILNPNPFNPIVTPGVTPTYNLPPKASLTNMETMINDFIVFLDGTSQASQTNRNLTLDGING